MPLRPLIIVVLGGFYAGVSIAHYFLDKISHQLSIFEGAPTYRLMLISPPTHLYWYICTLRVSTCASQADIEDMLIPIESAFSRHQSNEFFFVQGCAIQVDTSGKIMKIELTKNESTKRCSTANFESLKPTLDRDADNYAYFSSHKGRPEQTIAYHVLVIATGTLSHSPLFTLHDTHEETAAELRQFHRKLKSAHSIIIIGGGPPGVEAAGQLGICYNRRRRWEEFRALGSVYLVLYPESKKRNSTLNGRGTAIPKERGLKRKRKCDSGLKTQNYHSNLWRGSRITKIPRAVSKKAEKKLKKLGVHVVHNLRELGHTAKDEGSIDCHLNNDMTITADLLVSAIWVIPNTQFLPMTIFNEKGCIVTDQATLVCTARVLENESTLLVTMLRTLEIILQMHMNRSTL